MMVMVMLMMMVVVVVVMLMIVMVIIVMTMMIVIIMMIIIIIMIIMMMMMIIPMMILMMMTTMIMQITIYLQYKIPNLNIFFVWKQWGTHEISERERFRLHIQRCFRYKGNPFPMPRLHRPMSHHLQ